eukprot:3362533-Rhodomonas_salina.1
MATESLERVAEAQTRWSATRPRLSLACAPFSNTSSSFRSTSTDCSVSPCTPPDTHTHTLHHEQLTAAVAGPGSGERGPRGRRCGGRGAAQRRRPPSSSSPPAPAPSAPPPPRPPPASAHLVEQHLAHDDGVGGEALGVAEGVEGAGAGAVGELGGAAVQLQGQPERVHARLRVPRSHRRHAQLVRHRPPPRVLPLQTVLVRLHLPAPGAVRQRARKPKTDTEPDRQKDRQT